MKYGNRKTYVGGQAFDSALEARRFQELRLLERAGAIRDLQTQVKFELQPAFEKHGKKYRPIYYVADFVYYDVQKGLNVVEDAKGYDTDVYKIKKKMYEYRYDIPITEVRK